MDSTVIWGVYNGNILDSADSCDVVKTFDDYIAAEKYIAKNSHGKLWSIVSINYKCE